MIGNDDAGDAATVEAVDESDSNEAGRSGYEITALGTEESVATTCPHSLSMSPRGTFRSFYHRNVFAARITWRFPPLRCSVPNFELNLASGGAPRPSRSLAVLPPTADFVRSQTR